MAKQKKEIKEKAIEVTLWEAANKLRGSLAFPRLIVRFFDKNV